jgi:hypothetical protein
MNWSVAPVRAIKIARAAIPGTGQPGWTAAIRKAI